MTMPCENAEMAEKKPTNAARAANKKILSLIQFSFKGLSVRRFTLV
jgi:hypothetical protein